MKIQTKLFILLHILTLAAVICVIFIQYKNNRVAYVRCNDLVYGYWGMQEAHKAFEEKQNVWKANLDTLQASYQHNLQQYQMNQNQLSDKENFTRQQELVQEQQSLIQYSQSMDKKAKEEDDKLTTGALNQINSFVSTYGKNNDYKLILGTTQSGNLLYGEDAMDITEELLESLNRSYQEGKVK